MQSTRTAESRAEVCAHRCLASRPAAVEVLLMLREGEARGKRLAVYCLCDLYQPYQRQPRPVQCWVAHPTAHTCRSTAKPHESARCQRHVRCESELRGGAAPQSADVSRPFAWRHAGWGAKLGRCWELCVPGRTRYATRRSRRYSTTPEQISLHEQPIASHPKATGLRQGSDCCIFTTVHGPPPLSRTRTQTRLETTKRPGVRCRPIKQLVLYYVCRHGSQHTVLKEQR